MRFRVLLLVCFCVASTILVSAGNTRRVTADPTTFFVTNSNHQVLRINTSTSPATATVIYNGRNSFVPGDVTVGPDNKVYVCAPASNQILRMSQTGSSVETVYAGSRTSILQLPQAPKFDAAGDLLVNSSSGVWKFAGVAARATIGTALTPTHVLTFTENGQGLAFENDGTLTIVDGGGTVFATSVDCYSSGTNCSRSTLINSLSAPVGVGRDSLNNLYVAQSGANNILKCTTSGSCTVYATFLPTSPQDEPLFAKVANDDTLFVVTAQGGTANGKLWMVPPNGGQCASGGPPCLVYALTANGGQTPPAAVGLGLPATEARVESLNGAATAPVTQTYNYGHDAFQVNNLASTCDIVVRNTQKTPAAVNAVLASTLGAQGINVTALPESGQEGWINTYVAPSTANTLCTSASSPPFYSISMSNFILAPLGIRPQVARCDGAEIPVSGSPSGTITCSLLSGLGYFLFGALPSDPVQNGGTKNFSEYFLVNQTLATQTGQPLAFCGFQSPISTDPNNPTIINAGSAVPVKFQLAAANGTCSAGPFDGTATAFVSVQLLGGAFAPFIPPPASGNSNAPPTFRVDTSTGAPVYIYNLNTGKDWPTGTYSLATYGDKLFPEFVFFCVNACGPR